MKPWLLPLGVGLLAGSCSVFAVLNFQHKSELKNLIQESQQLLITQTEQEQNLLAVQERASNLEEANRELAFKLQSTPTEDTAKTLENRMDPLPDPTEQRRQALAQIQQRNLARWSKSLNLRPDQLTRLNQILQNQLLNPQADNAKNFSELQNELLKLLTPEQRADYDRIQARETQARTELRVNVQLSRVQSMFDLSEPQKDQIFQRFTAIEQTNPGTTASSQEQRQQQAQRRATALEGILKPEQIKDYQEALSNRTSRGDFRGQGWTSGNY